MSTNFGVAEYPRPIAAFDGAWTWWTRPRVTQIGDCLYIGAVATDGRITAHAYNLTSGQRTKFVLADRESDDHNNPAIIAVEGRPLVAIYTRHNLDDALRVRRSTVDVDADDWRAAIDGAWEAEQVLALGDGTTSYVQAFVTGDTIHAISRTGSTAWSYIKSTDWGETWGAPQPLADFVGDLVRLYCPAVLLADGVTLRVAGGANPATGELTDIVAFEVNLTTGAVSLPSDPTVIGNLDGTNLPLTVADCEVAYTLPGGKVGRVFDVSDHDDWEIVLGIKDADTDPDTGGQYIYVTHDGTSWDSTVISDSGRRFGYIAAGWYSSGAQFPTNTPGGRVFVGVDVDDDLMSWAVYEANLVGGSFALTELVAPSRVNIVRPWPVGDGQQYVLASEHRYYPTDDYSGYISDVVLIDRT